jgi:hypothetical protein
MGARPHSGGQRPLGAGRRPKRKFIIGNGISAKGSSTMRHITLEVARDETGEFLPECWWE